MSKVRKLRLWVTGREMPKDKLMFRVTHNEWVKSMNFINREHPKWEMIIVYDKESNEELKRYYNYDNKKTFPTSIHEV